MRILVAEDDPITRSILCATLERFGHEPLEAGDGRAALEALAGPSAPRLVLLDWAMPVMDGLEVCRRVREQAARPKPYLIMLTANDSKSDMLTALEAGADEYLCKPVDPLELKIRIEVGRRMVELQDDLARHAEQLQAALDQVRTLRGILPICSYCKKIRNDSRSWQLMEEYIGQHSDATFSHGICPECVESRVKPQLEALRRERSLSRPGPGPAVPEEDPGPGGAPPGGGATRP